MKNGFNNTKPEDKNFKDEFCTYYRITPEQFNELSQAENKTQYALRLQNMDILSQWEKFEKMTDKKFIIDSKKTQFDGITLEEIQQENERMKNGYYTPEAKEQRNKQAQAKENDKLLAERDKKIKEEEYKVKMQVLFIGGKSALDNCIYYNHSKELCFNWRSYDMISNELINKISAEIKLPEGVKIGKSKN